MPELTSFSNEFYATVAALAFAGMAVPNVWSHLSRARQIQDLAVKLRLGKEKRGLQTVEIRKTPRTSKRNGDSRFGRR